MFEGKFNLQKLQTRSVSAVVMITVVLFALFYGGLPFLILLSVVGFLSAYEWSQLSFKCEPVSHSYMLLISGAFYIVGSMACCYVIFEDIGLFWAITFLLMLWGSDSGAYFAGQFIGGPKMAASISPNKTWAGLGGAIIVPLLLGFLMMFIYRGVDDFSLIAVLMMGATGLFIGIAGQLGDLIISAFKRKAGVKDTGDLIPGHGGILDRIDSMLLAAPVFFLLFKLGHG